MDREKVVKELESLRDICNAKSNMAIGNGRVAWAGYANTADDAIALLKEQEAVEPYITGNGESFETAETWWYECGNCNKPIDPNDKFCRHCGQAVKWE